MQLVMWQKNIVAAGLAKKCEIQLSYAIGVAHPTSIMVDTFGTGKISDESLVEMIRKEFDLRPAGIIQMLDLRRPIYKQTAAYGHFGRNDLNLPWERLDKVEETEKIFEIIYVGGKRMRRYKKQISRIVTIAMLFAFLVGNSNMVHAMDTTQNKICE